MGIKFNSNGLFNKVMNVAKEEFKKQQLKNIEHLRPEIDSQGGKIEFNETGGIVISDIDEELTDKLKIALGV